MQGDGLLESALPVQGVRERMLPEDLQRQVIRSFGPLQDEACRVGGGNMVSLHPLRHGQLSSGERQPAFVSQRPGRLDRGHQRRGHRPDLAAGEIGLEQHQPQIDFLLPAFDRLGQIGEQAQCPFQLRGRLDHGRPVQREAPGFRPIRRRLVGNARLDVVMRQRSRRSRHDVGKAVFEHAGDLGMQELAPAAQQAVVGRVLHERVLEPVSGVGRRAALEDQLGGDELRKRRR